MAFQSVTLPYMERGRWGCGTPALNCTYRQHKYVCMKDSLPIICNGKRNTGFCSNMIRVTKEPSKYIG